MPDRGQALVLELAGRLHGAAIRLLRRVRREDIAMGLPPAQASALSVLAFGGATTLTGLARIEQVRAPTMSRIVDALEQRGFARRDSDVHDRRRARITATVQGIRIMEEGRKRRVRALADALAELGAKERATLASAVAILENLGGASAAAVTRSRAKK